MTIFILLKSFKSKPIDQNALHFAKNLDKIRLIRLKPNELF